MKFKKIIYTLCTTALLVACSSSPKYEQLTIADASIDDMAIEINDTPFQLYEPISKVLDHGEWTIKEAEIEQDLNEGERANLDLIYDGNEDHIITVNVMNTEKGKVKVKNAILQEINFVNSKDEAMRFELPSSVNLGTEVSSVLKKYGTPNMYDRKTNGDYQITYVCTKNEDIKNIMELSFKSEKLTEVKLKSKLSPYNMFNTTSFNLKKALGYEPYIDVTEVRETKSEELQKGVFHIDDLNICSQTVISDFYEKGWIIKTLATQDDFSYMILEKNNEMIYVAFNAVYDNVGDIGNDTKVDYVMLYNSPTLFQLNNQQNVSIDEIVDQYGTPNEVYYDAEKTIISYYANNGQNKIIFTANVDHELTEVRILLGQTFHGFETAWNTI